MCGRAVSSVPQTHSTTALRNSRLAVLAAIPLHVAKLPDLRHGPRPALFRHADRLWQAGVSRIQRGQMEDTEGNDRGAERGDILVCAHLGEIIVTFPC